MTEATRVRIEQLTGDIEHVEKLCEQGGTSIVYRIEAKKGSYLLKTATEARYQEWLAEEAIVLEEWMQRNENQGSSLSTLAFLRWFSKAIS